MPDEIVPHADPLTAHKRGLAKDQLFLQAMHAYLSKSELPPPRKLMAEMISIQMSVVDVLNEMLVQEARQRNLVYDTTPAELEALHEDAQKRLSRVLSE